MSVRALAKGSQLPPVNPDLMRIYSMRFCPFAQRTRMILLYKNIRHEIVNVNLAKKPKWLWERNPNGLVPIIEYKGEVVYESTVCGDFLDELIPEPRLQAKCPFQRAKDRLLILKYDRMVPNFKFLRAKTDEEREKAQSIVVKTLKVFQEELGSKMFFGGDQPGMLDFHVYPWIERREAIKTLSGFDIMPPEEFSTLLHWKNNMEKMQCVRATMLPMEWHMQFLLGLAQRRPQYDIGLEEGAETPSAKL